MAKRGRAANKTGGQRATGTGSAPRGATARRSAVSTKKAPPTTPAPRASKPGAKPAPTRRGRPAAGSGASKPKPRAARSAKGPSRPPVGPAPTPAERPTKPRSPRGRPTAVAKPAGRTPAASAQRAAAGPQRRPRQADAPAKARPARPKRAGPAAAVAAPPLESSAPVAPAPTPAPERVRAGSEAASGYAPFREAVLALGRRGGPSLLDRARAAAEGRDADEGVVPPMDAETADAVVMLVLRLATAKLSEADARDVVNSLPPPLTYDSLRGAGAWADASTPLASPTSPSPASTVRTGGGHGRKLYDVVGAEFHVDAGAARSLITAVVRVLKSQCPPERWDRVRSGLASEWRQVLAAV